MKLLLLASRPIIKAFLVGLFPIRW